MIKSMTILELTAHLAQIIKDDPEVANYKVFLPSDPEGNGYSTIDHESSFQLGHEDKILTIYPFQDGLQYDDIAPIEDARITEEVRKELGK